MPESRISRADRRTTALLDRLGSELRTARNAAGLTQRDAARATGCSPTEISRIERGIAPWVDVATLTRFATVVGLDLWIRTYPGGEPLRDAAHLRLTEALKAMVGSPLTIRGEVPVGDVRDRRAWDLTLTDPRGRICGTELETRIVDAQAQMRRITQKQRDAGVDRLLVVVADTRANRIAIRSAAPLLGSTLAIDDPFALQAVAIGELPPRDALIFVKATTRQEAVPSHGSRRRP
jgi:transcriptional regulator with XRE-family HTH domain